ncbi:MAG TPA: hypothetical protein VHL11_24185 [Phototrophicaceae bacterium]|nr:hypothetical protein [Phototrophicaceae bacterium]
MIKKKILRAIYPSLVGVLLGLLQTGLFFQLSFTLSSSYSTFLMVTLCWLIGSAIGVRVAKKLPFYPALLPIFSLLAYFGCAFLVSVAPFNTQIWFVYAFLVILTGIYPGVFFVRMGEIYSARVLFFRENNGFILGLISGTILFMLMGRGVLWIAPVSLAVIILLIREPVNPATPVLFVPGQPQPD